MSEMIRIVLVDDHPVVREGWASLIDRQDDMQVVGEASKGAEGLRLYEQLKPDLVLTDLRMPEMNGIEMMAAIRGIEAEAKIIVLTTYSGDEEIFQAIRAGANAYLLKDASKTELIGTIRKVHEGEKHIPGEIAEKLSNRIAADALSEREIEILRLIAVGRSNRQIGLELGIAEGTVKAHANNIFGKLKANDRTHAVTIALKKGIIELSGGE